MDPRRTIHASGIEAGGVGILADSEGAGADEDEFHLLAQRKMLKSDTSKTPSRPAHKVVRF